MVNGGMGTQISLYLSGKKGVSMIVPSWIVQSNGQVKSSVEY